LWSLHPDTDTDTDPDSDRLPVELGHFLSNSGARLRARGLRITVRNVRSAAEIHSCL
jgi:hypothetical protein